MSSPSSNGSKCTSTPTSFAIALGSNNTANADGFFTGAIANGDNSIADSQSNLSFAYASRKGSQVYTTGNLELAFAQGANVVSGAGATASDFGNVVLSSGTNTSTASNYAQAFGIGNLVTNFGNDNKVSAIGLGNCAFNLEGSGNTVSVGTVATPARLSSAFSTLGSKNVVTAGPGPLAVAGVLGLDSKTVNQSGPGFNVRSPLNP